MVNTLVWLSAVSLLADLRGLTHINERGVSVTPRHRSRLLPWYVPALSLHFPVGIWYSCLGPCAPLFASPPSNLMGVKPLLFCLKHREVTYLPPANEVWGKVIFSQASVILLTGGGGLPGSPPPPPGRAPHDDYCCGRYASYWNAFLYYSLINPFFDSQRHCVTGYPFQ